MTRGYPGVETIRAAIGLAQRAPSLHNSQPWRWRLVADTLDLYADPARHLAATDPQRRALILSCGVALHHLRIALATLGWAAHVRHVPDPGDPDHLAALRLTPRRPTGIDIGLTAAMVHRRSDRRRFRSGRIPRLYLRSAAKYAGRFGASVRPVSDSARPQLAKLIRVAAERHRDDALYQVELAAWSGLRDGVAEGIPARNIAPIRAEDLLPGRDFHNPALIDPTARPDAADWVTICTDGDDRAAQLRAGETLSALLLAATDLGLSTCVQTEPLGVVDLREQIRYAICDGEYPQAMVRAGVPLGLSPLPETPRRGLEDVVTD
ncbi:NAD(P)H nitroreductase [Nocardia sp. CDC159]|uniref:NAD(P)H nitroreductase n=1 Tax=Nocardia pulmonis TaxID=2951408 RepID=A0A9X2E5M8_9NOCA|nr:MULTISPECIES: NAD(P)H nitroreductase [Nocardia]MCM6772066.1 NAD(P)H nitroreductase [Nocardia pulmonis]MCM6785276.1 NAD(P)H nitroreductase [Nocardia sp. CDC159]